MDVGIIALESCVCYVRSCIAHRATSVFHLHWQLAADSAFSHWTPTSCKFSLNVARYVCVACLFFLFPLGGSQLIAVLGRWWFGMKQYVACQPHLVLPSL